MKPLILTIAGSLALGFASPAAAPVAIYDGDPAHLWNRLHSVLMTQAPGGQGVPDDLLDPPNLLRLQSGDPKRQAVAVLQEFTASPLMEWASPLRRAVLQRDLLAAIHLTAGENYVKIEVPQRELIMALAHAIQHVAMSAKEIRELPDNYAAALAAADAITVDDPEQPRPFLPGDLLADGGPWIAVNGEGTGGYAGKAHFSQLKGRSSFEVRMRHPHGREAGMAYLKTLAEMPQPLVWEKPAEQNPGLQSPRETPPWLNPATPQFPAGTMWAFVRRAILADANGQPVVSPLVESVQVRVYRSIKSVDEIIDAYPDKSAEAQLAVVEKEIMTSFEWEMRRSLLLGKGGFHRMGPRDLRYAHFAPVEGRNSDATQPIAGFCLVCHNAPGIHSIQSGVRQFSTDGLTPSPLALLPTHRPALDSATETKARELPGWTLLHWLWP